MSTLSNRATPRLLNTLAAALLAATAVTTAVTFIPSSPVHAETVSPIDPAHGFAGLVKQVMPAVVSVYVKYANVAANGAQVMPNS